MYNSVFQAATCIKAVDAILIISGLALLARYNLSRSHIPRQGPLALGWYSLQGSLWCIVRVKRHVC